jgi:hypothetical protein
MCVANAESSLLYFMLRMCSLYLILSVLPVCPMYTFLHSAHASLYIPVCSYLLVVILSLSILPIVFILKAIFMFVFLNFNF